MYFKRLKSPITFLLLLLSISISAQVTPPNADSDAECGEDCYDLFSWTPFEDSAGNVISGEGEAADSGCNTIISGEVEYEGNDSAPDYTGTSIGAGSQGSSPWTDNWTFSFGDDLTNPIIQMSGLFSNTTVTFSDCNGAAILATDISSGDPYDGSGNDEVQLLGTYNCIIVSFANDTNDSYTMTVGTCLGANPLPPCTDCGENNDFEYLSLTNASGSGTGATADVELNGVLYGSAEVLFSNLSISEDLFGSAFGAFASGSDMEETFVLKVELCEAITIQQLDVLGLETESEVWVGNGLSGTGQAATPTGFTFSQCGGPITMAPIGGNMVENISSSCSNQGNGNYTLGSVTTDIIYFKYNNPIGGCQYDKATFRIGVCVPDGEDAMPVCPLEYLTYTTDIEDYATNGPDFFGNDANAFQVMRDGNGVYFNMNCTQIQNDVADIDVNGNGMIDPEDTDYDGDGNVDAGSTLASTIISPCAELVDVQVCNFCDPPAPCVDCPEGSEDELISLTQTGVNADGLDLGNIFVDNVLVGSYEFEFSDLDVNLDGSGTTFGGFDNDGGTMILRLDFCETITINQLDVVNLEVMSMISVGTTITGTGAAAVLGDQVLTFCEGSERMDADDITNGNIVTTAGPGCGANPNASYTLGTTDVSTLYFKYQNPVGGCSWDYVGFKLHTCITPIDEEAIPVCPLEYLTYTTDIEDYATNGPDFIGNDANAFQVMRDGNGNYFDMNCTQITNDVMDVDANGDGDLEDEGDIDADGDGNIDAGILLPLTNISPCAELVDIEECGFCDPPPPCVDCPEGSSYELVDLDETGMNAAGLPIGQIEVDGVCIGQYEFEFSDLDVNEDGNGTKFGGFDNDGGAMVLRIDFCEATPLQQLDIINLEVESQVSIGSSISGTGAAATLSGLNLAFCAGSDRMDDDDITNGNTVTTAGPGCGSNPDASYNLNGNMVTTIYFKYVNPAGGCSWDYVGFNLGICYTPPVPAVPVCPIQEYQVACANVLGELGPTQNVMIDAAGNVFDGQSCNANIPAADGSGNVGLEEAIEMGILLETIDIGCAEIVEVIETECDFDMCTSVPVCTSCNTGEMFDYISLDQTGTATSGLDEGDVELNGAKIGTYEFLFSNLDINEDGVGSTFGGFDNDGGTMLLRMDLCEPLTIGELDVVNLEVESQVSIGTSASTMGEDAVLSGLTLTHCDGSERMDADDITNGNLITTAGPGCGANPNATYTVSPEAVSTLYFKYHNPSGGCSYDYVGFRIGACTADLGKGLPTCPLTVFEIDESPEDPNDPTYTLIQDVNGDWFDMNCPTTVPMSPTDSMDIVALSPCATITMLETCDVCFTCPEFTGMMTLPTDSPICAGADFTVAVDGLMTMAEADNNGTDFGIEFRYFDGATAPADAYTGGTSLGTVSFANLTSTNTEATLTTASIPTASDVPPGTQYTICAILTPDPSDAPILEDDCMPQMCQTITILDCQPTIEVTKDVVSVMPAASGTDGNFDVAFSVELCNTGNVDLNNISLIDDLDAVFGDALVDILVDPNIATSTTDTDPTLNGAYDGIASTDFFDAMSGLMNPDDCITVEFSIELDPNASDAPQVNVAMGAAKGVTMMGNPLIGGDNMPIMVMDEREAPVNVPNADLAKDFTNIDEAASDLEGNVDVTIELIYQNTGNVDLTNIQIVDDLASQFGTTLVGVVSTAISSSTATINPSLNAAYDGIGQTNLLNGTSGLVESNQSFTIRLVLELNPNAEGAPEMITNSASSSATGLDFEGNEIPVTDVSDSGSNTDSDPNTGEPGDTGGNEDPTPLPLPSISVAKDLIDVSTAPSGISGNFKLTYELIILNTGNVDLSNIGLMENLGNQSNFGSAFISVTTAPIITQSTASTDPVVNPSYNGSGNIFDGMSGLLLPGESLTVQVCIEIDPDAEGAPAILSNQATASADGAGPNGVDITVSDESDSGTDPEGQNPQGAGDSGGSSDATQFGECWQDACSALSCNDNINVSIGTDCILTLTPDMLIEGVDSDCFGTAFPSFFDIVLEDENGNPIPTDMEYGQIVIDASNILGGPIQVSVSTPCNNNTCWGTINVESKSAPVLEDCACPVGLDTVDVSEECKFRCIDVDYVLNSDALTPNPTAISCDPVEMAFSDQLIADDCGTTRIIRTWLASNENGSSTCTQEFLFDPIEISELRLPNSPVSMSCNGNTDPESIVALFDNPLTNDNPNTSYVENNEGYEYAYPTFMINGHAQKVDNQVCNIYAGYTDQDLDACGEGCNGNKKVIRTWTIVDWCSLETSSFAQIIKAVDDEGPTFILKDITLSTDPWGCSANVDVPQPWELHDNCTDDLTYTVSGPTGVVIVGDAESGYVALNAPKGTHTFTYTASDCCGNTTSQDATVTIYDGAAPVVVVKQNIVISLTSSQTNTEGIAKLYPGSIDNGSYDGCTDVHLEVRRDGNVGQNDCGVRGNNSYNDDNHPFDGSSNPNSPNYDPDGGAYVKFCCEDISAAVVDVDGDGTNDVGYHKVWLRVWDDGDMDGSFGSAGDNYNESWAYVKVEDKLAPAIICPPDVTLTCDMDYTDLSVTGEAQGYASCGGIDVEWNDIVNTLNTCNDMGFIRRRWNIVGRTDIFCDQRIDMTPLAGADPVVRFTPQLNDKDVTGCPEDIELSANERPTWVAGPCDVLGYTVEADTFYFEDGACLKIVREWTVINWCDYDPNNNPGAGVWRHTQVVKVTDDTQPTIESCDDLMFEINDHSDSDDDGNVCEAKITLTNIANDPGSDNCPTGWLKWQVFVDLWGDGTYDLEYSSFLPTNDGLFNDTNGNGIGDIYLEPTESGATVSVPLPDIDGSMSNHKVDWKVTDGCNNVRTCSQNFMVVDKKAPTPYCVSLSTAVMDMGADGNPGVELWASDFNVGSFDNCTAQEDLLYSFSGDSYVPNRTFGCDDVANSPVEVRMYVWDEKGNNDYCVVFLTVVDNQGLCNDVDGSRMIAGGIKTEAGEAVSDAEALLTAPINEYPRSQMTDEEGHYAFGSNPMGVNFTITADKDVDYLNGVSTLDLVKIQRHILGLEGLDSPYKLIAADINADDAIKANDLSQLRKLILGVITDLPTNDSWRFVDGSQDLALDMDLGTVNYEVNVDNLQSDEMNTNMVGVKVGDVTGNAVANLLAQTIEVRSAKTIDFVIENQTVKAGEEVEVTFTSADFADVYGYQFTMELNGLEFASVQGGAVSMTDANVGVLSNKVVTVSYNTSTARTAGQDEAVFTATFVATKDGSIANMIDVTSKVTLAEAYVGESLEIRDVTISTRGDIAIVATTELFQNEPNPFKGQTVVAFNLAEAAQATITVFDVAGKVIVKNNIDGVKGYNSVNFTANQLGTSGVLFYTLESGEFTATKRMIIVD